jgi:ATP-dependent Lon protease
MSSRSAAVVVFGSRVVFPGVVAAVKVTQPYAVAMVDAWTTVREQNGTKRFHSRKVAPTFVAAYAKTPTLSDSESQPNGGHDIAASSDVHVTGCLVRVLRVTANAVHSEYSLIVEGVTDITVGIANEFIGVSRCHVEAIQSNVSDTNDKGENQYTARIVAIVESDLNGGQDQEISARIQSLRTLGRDYISNLSSFASLKPAVKSQFVRLVDSAAPGLLADLLASVMDLTFDEQCAILCALDVSERIFLVLNHVGKRVEVRFA